MRLLARRRIVRQHELMKEDATRRAAFISHFEVWLLYCYLIHNAFAA